MSFLDKNNSEFVSARLTQEGRNAIANGDFKIDYFSVGDSEFDYTGNLKFLTGSLNGQKVLNIIFTPDGSKNGITAKFIKTAVKLFVKIKGLTSN